jgi:hypothetical protein
MFGSASMKLLEGLSGTGSVTGQGYTSQGGAEFNRETTPVGEDYFIILGQYGVGAMTAVPRLKELRQHSNPWIRLWAGEALERIAPDGH